MILSKHYKKYRLKKWESKSKICFSLVMIFCSGFLSVAYSYNYKVNLILWVEGESTIAFKSRVKIELEGILLSLSSYFITSLVKKSTYSFSRDCRYDRSPVN